MKGFRYTLLSCIIFLIVLGTILVISGLNIVGDYSGRSALMARGYVNGPSLLLFAAFLAVLYFIVLRQHRKDRHLLRRGKEIKEGKRLAHRLQRDANEYKLKRRRRQ